MREAGAIDFIKQFTFKDWDFLDQPRETIQDHVVTVSRFTEGAASIWNQPLKHPIPVQYHPIPSE